jgi:hypothetical protein
MIARFLFHRFNVPYRRRKADWKFLRTAILFSQVRGTWCKKITLLGRWFNKDRIVATYKASISSAVRSQLIVAIGTMSHMFFFYLSHRCPRRPLCCNTCCYSSRDILTRLSPLLWHPFTRPIRSYISSNIMTDFRTINLRARVFKMEISLGYLRKYVTVV